MVTLSMIGHDEVDFLKINFFFQILYELKPMGQPDSINEDVLLPQEPSSFPAQPVAVCAQGNPSDGRPYPPPRRMSRFP